MHFSTLFTGATVAVSTVLAGSGKFQVPVPWNVTGMSVSNVRHGTGGYWKLNISDPSSAPQGFKTTCSYHSSALYFVTDQPPYDAPCNNPDVTFGMFPKDGFLVLNVTHKYSTYCGVACKKTSVDNGTWHFSMDDVKGQESDVDNNFGQDGYFHREKFYMYPARSVPSMANSSYF